MDQHSKMEWARIFSSSATQSNTQRDPTMTLKLWKKATFVRADKRWGASKIASRKLYFNCSLCHQTSLQICLCKTQAARASHDGRRRSICLSAELSIPFVLTHHSSMDLQCLPPASCHSIIRRSPALFSLPSPISAASEQAQLRE